MVVRKRDKSIGFDELSPHLVIKPSKSWHINSLSQRTKGFQFTQTWDDENANGCVFQYFRFVVFFKVYICVWWSFLDWVGGWVGGMKAILMVRLARSDQKMLSAVVVKITMEMMMVLIRFVDDHCDGRSVGLC